MIGSRDLINFSLTAYMLSDLTLLGVDEYMVEFSNGSELTSSQASCVFVGKVAGEIRVSLLDIGQMLSPRISCGRAWHAD